MDPTLAKILEFDSLERERGLKSLNFFVKLLKGKKNMCGGILS
jgi:hypothetical protein